MIRQEATIPLHKREMMEPWSWLMGMRFFNTMFEFDIIAKAT